MISSEQKRFDAFYDQHLRALKLHGYAASTIDVYARAVRRLSAYFDAVPDQLSVEQLESYFAELVDSHSWATVRVDRNGLQFFWEHILKRDWQWVKIIRPPSVRSLPDVLSVGELEQVIAAARRHRYRVFVLTCYSMGRWKSRNGKNSIRFTSGEATVQSLDSIDQVVFGYPEAA